MSAPAAVLRGVDRASFAVALAGRLRDSDVPVSLSSVAALVEGWGVLPPRGRTALYWLCRVSLVRRVEHLPTFDAVFEAVFADSVLALDPVARGADPAGPAPADDALVRLPSGADHDGAGSESGLPWATAAAVVAVGGDGGDSRVPELVPSGLDAAADTPFERLDPALLADLEQWLADAMPRWPTRRSRRLRTHRAGRTVVLRATLARARRTGFETVEIARGRAVLRPRPLVVVCDVSESMRGHASAYLHLMRAAARVTDAEAFGFSTRLTRLTPQVRLHSPEAAVRLAEQACGDRFGGTRIATSLHGLLHSHHAQLLRGAVVVIASDGWDSDAPADLATAMARVHRLAHRVVWLNPRAAAPGFRPRTGGMAAALPWCDELLPAHTPAAMREVLRVITARG
ncbi:VWA domain-containing protein [Jannaschia sp. R86511]|uniref:vWA domain-containing protein n=1 Tax=Jannaschia sp. R86511 TaxID=3093853 RepID=UPI0036D3113D